MRGYPTLTEAEKIWLSGIEYHEEKYGYPKKEEYIAHSRGVAWSAKCIAENTKKLNPNKAFILGLLHDYGKKEDEGKSGKFHGQVGYDELLAMGYNESARICLTHSFPKRLFNNEDYSSFKPEWIIWAHKKLENIEYDDYDRLIQLCDMFFEGMEKVGYEDRLNHIEVRYHLTHEQTLTAREFSKINKKYFDDMCQKDIYKILDIKTY